MMDRFLDFVQGISDWWFAIDHRKWRRLTIFFISAFGLLVPSSVAFGVCAAIWWRDGLWIAAALIASTLVAMQLAGLFGMMSCITDKEEN